MPYHAYLLILSQLQLKSSARFQMRGRSIHVEYLEKKKRWLFSTQIYESESVLPQEIAACLSRTGSSSRSIQGMFLKQSPDASAVLLQKEVSWDRGKYLPFKQSIEEFLSMADEWQDIFSQLATSKIARS